MATKRKSVAKRARFTMVEVTGILLVVGILIYAAQSFLTPSHAGITPQIFVSNKGDNISGDGTKVKPYRTIRRAWQDLGKFSLGANILLVGRDFSVLSEDTFADECMILPAGQAVTLRPEVLGTAQGSVQLKAASASNHVCFRSEGSMTVAGLAFNEVGLGLESQGMRGMVRSTGNTFIVQNDNGVYGMSVLTSQFSRAVVEGNKFTLPTPPTASGGNTGGLFAYSRGGLVTVKSNLFAYKKINKSKSWNTWGIELQTTGDPIIKSHYVVAANTFTSIKGGNMNGPYDSQIGITSHANTIVNDLVSDNKFSEFDGLPVQFLGN